MLCFSGRLCFCVFILMCFLKLFYVFFVVLNCILICIFLPELFVFFRIVFYFFPEGSEVAFYISFKNMFYMFF
ncbi:unnamed protein product [Meloidogyne enterolobii]|uniref:Uncharacterized protein n=2 Tax=Meloidogyne enterolobii TaxID=390850 RepID=A0ACB1AHN0_MELEN